MQDVFKDIPGFEGRYQVSNTGLVKTLNHKNHKGIEKIMFIDKTGDYARVNLTVDGKVKKFPIHRLVALAFIANTENKPQVNHKDGDKHNNALSNLEWVTHSENVKHSYRTLGQKPNAYWSGKLGKDNFLSKPIEQYTKTGDFVKKFFGIAEAYRLTGINNRNISACCRGKLGSAGGFVWKYAQ